MNESRREIVDASSDDAGCEFLSEEKLHVGGSSSTSIPTERFVRAERTRVQRKPLEIPDVEIVDVDDLAVDFLSEADLRAVNAPSAPCEQVVSARLLWLEPNYTSDITPITVASPKEPPHGDVCESSQVQHAVTAVIRTWSVWPVSGAVAVGLAALTGTLALNALRTPNGAESSSDSTIATTIEPSSTPGEPTGGLSVSTMEFVTESDRPPGGFADRRLQQTSPVPASSAASRLRDEGGHGRSAVEVEALLQPSEEPISQVTNMRDAEGNPSQNEELPDGSRPIVGNPSTASDSGSTIRVSAFNPARTEEGGADHSDPVALAAAESLETVLTSADTAAPVRDLLADYQAAYGRLDVRQTKEIWPSVNERALARAFNGLESQTVTFDTCDVTVSEVRAIASCRGSATYVTRMGHRTSHTESRQWTFLLEKSAERWVINAIQIR